MALKTRVQLQILAALSAAGDLQVANAPVALQTLRELVDGAGVNQATKVFADTRILTTGQTEDLDLNGGGLLDPFGVALVFAELKMLAIVSRLSNVTDLTVLGDANSVPIFSAAATTAKVSPGGIFLYLNPSDAGIVVTAATGDIIQVANAAGSSATYDIVIVGT